MGDTGRSAKACQALITDFFRLLQRELIEVSDTSSPFHQSLITDFFRERSVAPALSESIWEVLSSEGVNLASLPETPTSKFPPSFSTYTHITETPEIRLARARHRLLLQLVEV